MNSIKMLHCADIHFDAPFTTLSELSGLPEERRKDIRKTFDVIINKAISYKAKYLLISGDLFEHDYIKKSTVAYINNLFEKIPQVNVCIIPGNHDIYSPSSYYNTYEWSKNTYILTKDNPTILFEEDKVCIKYYLKGQKFQDNSNINILMFHGSIDIDLGDQNYNFETSGNLEATNADYIACGHFHNRKFYEGNRKNIFNPGSPEPLGFDELGEHGIYLVEINKDDDKKAEIKAEFFKTNQKQYCEIDITLKGQIDSERVIELIQKKAKDKLDKQYIIKAILKGRIAPASNIDNENIKNFFYNKKIFMKIKNLTLIEFDTNMLSKDDSIKGVFYRKMTEKIKKTDNEDEKYLFEKALYFGLEALEGKEPEIDLGEFL